MYRYARGSKAGSDSIHRNNAQLVWLKQEEDQAEGARGLIKTVAIIA